MGLAYEKPDFLFYVVLHELPGVWLYNMVAIMARHIIFRASLTVGIMNALYNPPSGENVQ